MMITPQEYQPILQKCKEIPPAKGMYLIHDYIENLVITVLDFQMNQATIDKAIRFFKDNRFNEIRNFSDMKQLLSKYPDNKEGNTAVAQYLWEYRYWTRVSLLRRLVAYFESIGVTSQEALRHWAENSRYEKDFQGKVKGMAYAIYQWLVMRQGIETIKPDTHLKRFVESAIHHSFTERELVEVLEKVAKELGLKAYELDWKIWEYQRTR